jgi:hypothetical protein
MPNPAYLLTRAQMRRLGVFDRIFAALAAEAGPPHLMVDSIHFKARRTATSLLQNGLFPNSTWRTTLSQGGELSKASVQPSMVSSGERAPGWAHGASICRRRCNRSATDQHRIAQAEPAHHPARTSLA